MSRRVERWGLLVAAVLWLTAPTSAHATDPDPWLGRDKAVHFGVSATLALGGWAVGIPLFDEPPPRFVLGASLAITAGIGKELYDWAGHGRPSWRDFTWDLLGTGVGLLLAWMIDALWVQEPAPTP